MFWPVSCKLGNNLYLAYFVGCPKHEIVRRSREERPSMSFEPRPKAQSSRLVGKGGGGRFAITRFQYDQDRSSMMPGGALSIASMNSSSVT